MRVAEFSIGVANAHTGLAHTHVSQKHYFVIDCRLP